VAGAAQNYHTVAVEATRSLLCVDGVVQADLAHRHQRVLHGMAWVATTVAAIASAAQWAQRLARAGRLAEAEILVLKIGLGEYLEQLTGGIPMGQNEIFRPHELGLDVAAKTLRADPAVAEVLRHGNTPNHRLALMAAVQAGATLADDLPDPELNMVREQFRRFSNEQIAPYAQRWHLADELIPQHIVDAMAELGVFGVCIATEHGGLGLGKLAMCVVTEELSRAWIAAGSLGTRSEIAGELISLAGTPEQKARWLPDIASGAVFRSGFIAHSGDPSARWQLAPRRQQDLDHPRLAQRPDDGAGSQRRRYQRLCRSQHVSGSQASRNSARSVPGRGYER
jgi:(2S)-methylsuccinyl-CoA dehydrogenase